MLKTQTVHFLLLLDKSASMYSVRDTTVKGVNEYIQSIADASKDSGLHSTVSIITFNNDVEINPELMHQDPDKFNGISAHYNVGGGTAIYDVLGEGISSFDNLPDESNVIVSLFTDGEECSSQKFNEISAKAMVKWAKKLGWIITFISPKDNCNKFAEKMGIPTGNVLKYESGNTGTRTAFSKLGRAVERYVENLKDGISGSKNTFFSDLEQHSDMKVKDMQVVLNMPLALKSKKNKNTEIGHELPPYAPVDAYVVDEYPACPANWMHGSSKASSYFVAVKPERGMWLDFNGCNKEYDVAAVISVQGINPITGKKSDTLRLERYENKCPQHGCDFQQDRFCPECVFKWPAQNYLATTSTPDGYFWLDGFRSEDGKVRQYIFTEEMVRGVANAIIGEDKVYAIGIAFFKSKKKRTVIQRYSVEVQNFYRCIPKCGDILRSVKPSPYVNPDIIFTCGSGGASVKSHMEYGSGSPDKITCNIDSESDNFAGAVIPKNYEVGAGAIIKQEVHEDKESLDYWENEPEGLIYINYVDKDSVEKILEAGRRQEKKEGFLNVVKVGN